MMRLLAVCAALLASTACHRGEAAALPYYESSDFTPTWTTSAHRIGAFSLTTQTGAPITDRDLAGRIHVASFIYTRCSAICPMLVSNLKRVQAAVDDPGMLLVSYSVTPDLDSPAVLEVFGREQGIAADRWKLVTGDRDQIYSLARDSYFASDERLRATLDQADAFLHTEKLVLVDRQGKLRGVYDGTQPFEIDHVIDDARMLLAEHE